MSDQKNVFYKLLQVQRSVSFTWTVRLKARCHQEEWRRE